VEVLGFRVSESLPYLPEEVVIGAGDAICTNRCVTKRAKTRLEEAITYSQCPRHQAVRT
jgi:hypothetical protein